MLFLVVVVLQRAVEAQWHSRGKPVSPTGLTRIDHTTTHHHYTRRDLKLDTDRPHSEPHTSADLTGYPPEFSAQTHNMADISAPQTKRPGSPSLDQLTETTLGERLLSTLMLGCLSLAEAMTDGFGSDTPKENMYRHGRRRFSTRYTEEDSCRWNTMALGLTDLSFADEVLY